MSESSQSQSAAPAPTPLSQSATAQDRVRCLGDNLAEYDCGAFYDEMFLENGTPRPHYRALFETLGRMTPDEFQQILQTVNSTMLMQGITFTVYNNSEGTERIFPFDLIPRIISSEEWSYLEKGLEQRIRALNAFVHDVYHDQKILKDKVIPEEIVLGAKYYRSEFRGCDVPHDIYIHICGTDIVRDADGQYYVLEDNGRSPSGVSYMLENRALLKRAFSPLFSKCNVASVRNYPIRLRDTLEHIAPPRDEEPTIAVLTPGVYNSAYFEHTFLARAMGVAIVEGRDLIVQDKTVYMRTIHGLKRVDVLYRRIDDDFLDPLVFRKDSVLGVPGLIEAYRAGNLGLANSIGTGVADDKLIYNYVPQMIRYYLDEDMSLPNVETYLGSDPAQCDHILQNADKLVIKPVNESGGYGIVVGPHATKREIEEAKDSVRSDPRNWVAQRPISLSRHPTWCDDHLAGRHIDLRPYILYGEKISITPGGLTRVALREGSLVVNSSQGGGSKDTWVLNAPVKEGDAQ